MIAVWTGQPLKIIAEFDTNTISGKRFSELRAEAVI
jgi:hypothetical protein